jgi:septum formation protein
MTDTPAITLASASPRRRELLGFLEAPFRTAANDAEEQEHEPPSSIHAALPPLDLPLLDHPTLRAWRKADAACTAAPHDVIIGADTIVVLDGAVLNKPRDAADARRMLRMLAGRAHTVYTGLCVLRTSRASENHEPRTRRRQDAREDHRMFGGDATNERFPVLGSWPVFTNKRFLVLGSWSVFLDLVATEVVFHELSDAAIEDYVATGEPLDKAGAYGVQAGGGLLIDAVRGSYTNVVGLPLVNLHGLLEQAGVPGLAEPAAAYHRWLATQGKEPLPCPPTFP